MTITRGHNRSVYADNMYTVHYKRHLVSFTRAVFLYQPCNSAHGQCAHLKHFLTAKVTQAGIVKYIYGFSVQYTMMTDSYMLPFRIVCI